MKLMASASIACLEPFSLPFCFLSIPKTYFRDTIVLGYASTELHCLLRAALLSAWPDCIQKEVILSPRELRIKLRGRPFLRDSGSQRSSEAGDIQELVTAVLRAFYHAQWCLKASVSLVKTGKACSLFFERQWLGHPPVLMCNIEFGAVGLIKSDRLLLTGLMCVTFFARLVRAVVERTWPPGVRESKAYPNGSVKLVLRGKPWRDGCAEARQLILTLIRALAANNVRVYASTHPQPTERAADTLYVAQVPFPYAMGDTFLLGLHGTDGIHLVEAPEEVVNLVRCCLLSVWTAGPLARDEGAPFEDPSALGGVHIFQLREKPWVSKGYASLLARYLLVRLFEELRAAGWRLHATFDLGSNADDLSCFCFERCTPSAVTFEVFAYMALCATCEKRLRFVNAAPLLVEEVRQELALCWPEIVRGLSLYEGFPELSLRLRFEDAESVFSRLFFALAQRGWRIIASADVCAGTAGVPRVKHASGELSTMLFEKRVDVAETLPPPPPSTH